MTWSYSRIKSFFDCPYRWFLKYIHKSNETPQFYSSFGLFMHELIEKYYKKEYTRSEMRQNFLLNFQNEVKGERPNSNIVAKYINSALIYIDSFEDFPCKTVSVEEKVEFEINGLPFVGVIDYVGQKNGELCIIDNKSRALKPRSNRKKATAKDNELDEMLTQLYIYSKGIEQQYGKLPATLSFNCFRNNVFITEPFDRGKYEKTIEWVSESVEQIEETVDFPPNIDYFKCKYICGVNNDCCYYQGGIL